MKVAQHTHVSPCNPNNRKRSHKTAASDCLGPNAIRKSRTSEKERGPLKQDLLWNQANMLDECVVGLFNAYNASLRQTGSRYRTFEYPLKGSVSRLRSIIHTWERTAYDPIVRTYRCFGVPYVLSQFLDRYIGSDEAYARIDRSNKAVRKFVDSNRLGDAIDGYVLEHPMLSPLIVKMTRLIDEALPCRFNPVEWYPYAKHGPNSTAGVKRNDAYLHIKAGDVSGTRASLQQFLHYLQWDTRLHDLLVERSDGFRSSINTLNLDAFNVVDSAPTHMVPKNYKIFRAMQPEPTTVGFMANCMSAALTEVLRSSCNIDLSSQPHVHQLLAKLGSGHPNLNIATLDWTDASSRIWLVLCEVLFSGVYSQSWYNYMVNCCRVPNTTVKLMYIEGDEVHGFDTIHDIVDEYGYTIVDKTKCTDKHSPYYRKVITTVEVTIRTNMMATMGNPITFPLQTLVFWAFLTACTELTAETAGNSVDEYQFVTCFGDDGIVDARCIPTVEYYANLLNWEPNMEKTFVKGKFRESCGGDYYDRHDVKAFAPKGLNPIETNRLYSSNHVQSWLYSITNNTLAVVRKLRGDESIIVSWLKSVFARHGFGDVLVVPPSAPEGSGLRFQVDWDESYSYDSTDWYALSKRGLLPNEVIFSPCVWSLRAPSLDYPISNRYIRDGLSFPIWDAELQVYKFKSLAITLDTRDVTDDHKLYDVEAYYLHDALRGPSSAANQTSDFMTYFDVDGYSCQQLSVQSSPDGDKLIMPSRSYSVTRGLGTTPAWE